MPKITIVTTEPRDTLVLFPKTPYIKPLAIAPQDTNKTITRQETGMIPLWYQETVKEKKSDDAYLKLREDTSSLE